MSVNEKTTSDRAVACFHDGFNCAQAVLSAFGPSQGLDENACLKVACAFGAGMGRMQQVCGAVTGAFMVLGLKYGKGRGDGEERKSNTYDLVREFARRFEERHGSLLCGALLGCDITTAEGLARAREQGLFVSRCEIFVRDAALILDGILDR